jgi:hypothetical protein
MGEEDVRRQKLNVFRMKAMGTEVIPVTTGSRTLRDAVNVLRRPGGRRLLDARAADLINVGGPDLLAAQAALKPIYDLAN